MTNDDWRNEEPDYDPETYDFKGVPIVEKPEELYTQVNWIPPEKNETDFDDWIPTIEVTPDMIKSGHAPITENMTWSVDDFPSNHAYDALKYSIDTFNQRLRRFNTTDDPPF